MPSGEIDAGQQEEQPCCKNKPAGALRSVQRSTSPPLCECGTVSFFCKLLFQRIRRCCFFW